MTSNKKIELWTIQNGTLTMFLAEMIGTATLIFIGCMSCVGTMGSEPPPPMQISITFGFTICLIIMSYGHLSGAHLNPAVTLGAVVIGLKSIPTGIVYVIAQFIGATIGYGLLKIVTPERLMSDGSSSPTTPLCLTSIHPGISTLQAILIEILCTSLILIGACATWDPRCAHTTDSTALRFGVAVAALSFAAGPYTGCSMNPARSFAPAVWNGAWENQWVYLVGPIIGGAFGTMIYKFCFLEKNHSGFVKSITPKNEPNDYNENIFI